MVRSIQGYTMALPIHTPKQCSHQQAGSTIPIREMLPDVCNMIAVLKISK